MIRLGSTIIDNSALAIEEVKKAVDRGLEKVGIAAEAEAKKHISGKYDKSMRAVQTGRLRNSLTHAVKEGNVYIGTNVEYAPYVEMGTSRQRAKPYLEPAATQHLAEYERIFRDELKSAF